MNINSINDIIRVPASVLQNVSRVQIPSYLLGADEIDVSPILPELFAVRSNGRVAPIPRSTACLSFVTKSSSSLREAVDSCVVSYALHNERRAGGK